MTLVLAALLLAPMGVPAGADDTTPWSVTVRPTSGLTDGQTVSITVKTTPDFVLYEAMARVCRHGVSYQAGDESRPNPDFSANGPNCPLTPLSSSADPVAVDSTLAPNDTTPDGETFPIKVGTGVVNWSAGGVPTTLTCDANNPCDLVVELLGGPADAAPVWFPTVHPLNYENSDPVAGCGGPASGILSAGGSDALTDAWVGWTLAQCKTPGQVGAATRMTFDGEGTAVANFASGNLDIAYSAVGYDADAGFVPPDSIPGGPRATVAVPVALGASVLGLANGHFSGVNNRKVPYGPTNLTADEVAALLSGGPSGDIQGLIPTIDARNPDLLQSGFFDTNSSLLVGAPSDAEGSSWIMTRHLAANAPGEWKVPNLPLYGADAGRTRGADASLAVADPSYNQALALFTGRPSLRRSLETLGPDQGGVWVLTDLTTADALGMTAVSIGSPSGAFVAPTPETMAAAVPTMQTTADGLLIPNPTASAPAAYPLTYVEYAMVPAQPLIDPATCTPRAASQVELTKWLDYLTGPGQLTLPEGLTPLTPGLAAAAKGAIAKVGATPAPEGCTPAGPPDGSGGPVGGSFANAAGAPPADLVTLADLGAGSVDASSSSSNGAASQTRLAAAVHVPGYGGTSLPSALVTALALMAVVALTSSAAFASSGRWWKPAGRSVGLGGLGALPPPPLPPPPLPPPPVVAPPPGTPPARPPGASP